jgi:hypothetical protein
MKIKIKIDNFEGDSGMQLPQTLIFWHRSLWACHGCKAEHKRNAFPFFFFDLPWQLLLSSTVAISALDATACCNYYSLLLLLLLPPPPPPPPPSLLLLLLHLLHRFLLQCK